MLKQMLSGIFHHKKREPVLSKFTIQKGCLVAWSGQETVLKVPSGVSAIRFELNHHQKSVLKQVILPKGLKEIGDGVFRGCYSLEHIEIPGTVKQIGDYAFTMCFSLRSITLPESLREIGNSAFKGCSNLAGCVLPKKLKKIGAFAFDGARLPESVAIPMHIQQIENDTFNACRGLKQVIIPAGLSRIGEHAFSWCRTLETVVFETDSKQNAVLHIGEGAFERSVLKHIELPERLERLSASVFRECKELTHVVLPEHIKEIPQSAFYGCEALERIDGFGNIESIEESAFYACKSLKQIPSAKRLRKIEKLSFAQCHRLHDITFPESIESIGERAFSRCISLAKVVIPDTISIVEERAFENCRDLETVEYTSMDDNAEAFVNTPVWRRRKHLPQIPKKLPGHIRGNISGKTLREWGYSFFAPDRNYYICEPSEAGVIQVSSFCEDDGMDEEGFGREFYYDYWLMDERLEPILGVKCLKCMASQDMRFHEAEWQAEKEKAAYILHNSKHE